jgi:hypothetical protein
MRVAFDKKELIGIVGATPRCMATTIPFSFPPLVFSRHFAC